MCFPCCFSENPKVRHHPMDVTHSSNNQSTVRLIRLLKNKELNVSAEEFKRIGDFFAEDITHKERQEKIDHALYSLAVDIDKYCSSSDPIVRSRMNSLKVSWEAAQEIAFEINCPEYKLEIENLIQKRRQHQIDRALFCTAVGSYDVSNNGRPQGQLIVSRERAREIALEIKSPNYKFDIEKLIRSESGHGTTNHCGKWIR